MIKYECTVCGAQFEVKEGETPVCPVCKATDDMFIVVGKSIMPRRQRPTLRAAFGGESGSHQQIHLFRERGKERRLRANRRDIPKDRRQREEKHAKLWFKAPEALGGTAENLVSAAAGEHYEWTEMYTPPSSQRGRRDSLRSSPRSSER